MQKKLLAVAVALLIALRLTYAAPTSSSMSNDLDSAGGGGSSNGAEYYNSVMGHFKDFFMYMPVMMTTLKETMTGFPKFAEGVRILTSKTGRIDDDCKCKLSSNEIA